MTPHRIRDTRQNNRRRPLVKDVSIRRGHGIRVKRSANAPWLAPAGCLARKNQPSRRINRGSQILAAQRGKKAHQCLRLRRAQSVAIGWHVAAALQHLADHLVLGHPRRNRVQRRPAQPACSAQGVAVAALLVLQHQRALPLQRRTAREILHRRRIARPCRHDRTPRRIRAQVRKNPQRHSYQRKHQHRYRPPRPVLLALAGHQRQQQQHANSHHRRDKHEWRLKLRRQIRQHRVDPEERKIRLRRRLDNGWVRLAASARRARRRARRPSPPE